MDLESGEHGKVVSRPQLHLGVLSSVATETQFTSKMGGTRVLGSAV